MSEVSASVRKQTGVNYLTVPLQNRNDDAVKMLRGFMDLVFNEGKVKEENRLENLIRCRPKSNLCAALYGRNKKVTAEIKGFNCKMIDTSNLQSD